MKTKLLVVSSIFLIVISFFVFTIAYSPQNQINTENSVNNYGGSLIVGITGDIDSFNPLFNESSISREVTHLMLLGLADLNEKMEFESELASSWEKSDDHLMLTYNLRKDAFWSDGVQITAEDVKFTFDLLKDSVVASPNKDIVDYVKDVSVKDSFTVIFEFSEAYPTQIFDTAWEILPKHILNKADRKTLRSHPFGRAPISSGPFKLKKWVSQQYIELEPNENYFGKRPFLSQIIFKIVPNNTNLITQLKTGEVDMVIGISPEQVNQIEKSNSKINIYPVSGRLYHYVGYNQDNPLFSKVNIRKALTMAIDRTKIIDALLFGFGTKCIGHLPPMIPWAYNNEIEQLPFDVQKAKELLKAEGWKDYDKNGWLDKNGKEFHFSLKVNSGNQLKSDVAVVIQNQLQQVGVKVDIKNVEWSAYLDDLRNGKFDAHLGAWSTSLYIDPTPIFHSSSFKLFNWTKYSNPRVDRFIEIGREEMDQDKASKIWKEFQEIVYDDQPYTFLYWIDRIVAVNSKFKNVQPIPLSSLYKLEEWYIESKESPLSLK